MKRVSAALCALLGTNAMPADAQSRDVRVELHGRMHYQWNTTSVDPAETEAGVAIARSTFEQRRVRLTADVQISDWIRGRVEPDFAGGRVQLRNAWVALQLDPALTLRAGQFKKPFDLIHLTSGSELPVIERGVRIRGLDAALLHAAPDAIGTLRGDALVGENFALLDLQKYTAYEMGVAAEARHGRLGVSAGVFNGTGPDARAENAGPSAAARATLALPVDYPVALGAGWSRRTINWPLPSSLETRAGDAFTADVQVGAFRRGVWLLASAVTGDNLATEQRFTGAQGILAWFVPVRGRRIEGFEPAVRVSWGDPDDDVAGDDGVLLTPGFNLYFSGRNRLQLNWDVYMPRADALQTQHAARAQFNLEF